MQDLDGALNSHHVSSSNSSSSFGSLLDSDSKGKMKNFFNISSPNKKLKAIKAASRIASKPTQTTILSSFFPKTTEKTEKDQSDSDSEQIKVANVRRNKRKNSLRKETVISSHVRNNEQEKKIFDADLDPNNIVSKINIHKESLILFDEIDIVFKEDVGFWSAVNYFIKKSKKPIIMTTNDEYLQEKINLNVEKIEFIRPRVDASIKYLKSIAKRENIELDTPTAYKLVRESKCDMRRALVQLQAIIGKKIAAIFNENNSCHRESYQNSISACSSAGDTFELDRILCDSIKSECVYHTNNYFESLFYLDQLTLIFKTHNLDLFNSMNVNVDESSSSFRKYDSFILKDGLNDYNAILSSSTSSSGLASNVAFNPFITNTNTHSDLNSIDDNDRFRHSSITLRDHLYDFYETYISLFNDKRLIELRDWSKYGHTNKLNFASNNAINKFAQATHKFTSNSSLYLDYRPALQQICHHEELKQAQSSRRRFAHYLLQVNFGLSREDYSLLAKSNLRSHSKVATLKKNTPHEKSNDLFCDEAIFDNL
jgi:DNA polymerase III delta prime subunit